MKKHTHIADIVLYSVIGLQCASIIVLSRIFSNPEHKTLRDVLLFFLYMTGIPVIGGLCLFFDRRRAERKRRLSEDNGKPSVTR